MTSSLRPTSARLVAPVAAVLSLLVVTAGPAVAAKAPAHTTISVHLTPSTVLVKATASVSGTVTPTGGSLALQRLVGKTWTTVAHATPSRTGSFAFTVRAPKAAASWSLKVVRGASSSAKAGASATLHLHVVTKQFAVAAASASTVTVPAASVITGVVVPSVSGTVQVQRLVGNAWSSVATGKLGAGGAFSVTTALPVGPQHLRVVKPFTSAVAQGTSTAFTVTVSAPAVLAAPTVTTAAIPAARVGVPYAALLTATGGSGFYSWAATGLPAGLTVSAAGLLGGTPTAQGTASFPVTVTDSAGHTATQALSLTIGAQAGYLVAAGHDSDGELGNGGNTNAQTVVPVTGMSSVTTVATGQSAGLAVKSDGTLWSWGENGAGELGNGTTNSSAVPIQVPGLTGVTAVAEGYETSYAVKSDGTVWAWGDNTDGEIGDGTATPRHSPVQVSGLTSVVQVSSGMSYALALRSDGTVWAWGYNGDGELGTGGTTPSKIPVQVPGLTGIKQLATGDNSAFALRSDGTVAAWGDDTNDVLGDGSPNPRALAPVTVSNLSQVTQIAAAHDEGFALTATGALFGWGYNGESELGGATANNPSGVVQIRTGVLQVSADYASGYALLADHTVVAWGLNQDGELGVGTIATAPTPTPMTGVGNVLSVIGDCLSEAVFLIVS